jgi:hypothetical protein
MSQLSELAAPIRAKAGCKPWCAEHDEEANGCYAPMVDDVSLHYFPGEGSRITSALYDGVVDLTPGEANRLGWALLSLAAQAQGPAARHGAD